MNAPTDSRILVDVVCTACGSMCDDLRLEVVGDRVVSVAPSCKKAEAFFLRDRRLAPRIRVDGQPAALNEAAARAAQILYGAEAPLVMGLERSTTEAQRQAIAIADACGAFFDPTDESGRSQNHVALQTVG
ncbi:MAG: formylmethanofuran dehydrogenase subunit B, partial [Planctomycetota bacterium]